MRRRLPHAAGRVEDILQAYDRERRVLPPPVRMWEWGWTKSAETWNGRIASARAPLASSSVCCVDPCLSTLLTKV